MEKYCPRGEIQPWPTNGKPRLNFTEGAILFTISRIKEKSIFVLYTPIQFVPNCKIWKVGHIKFKIRQL